MKKIIGLIVGWLPMLLTAQTITVSEDIVLKNDVAYEVIGELKDRILLFRDRVTEFEVQAFNTQMKMVWSKELQLDKKSPKSLGLVATKEDFTLFLETELKVIWS